jgi:tetratricopeptide (TPR) repeat protein
MSGQQSQSASAVAASGLATEPAEPGAQPDSGPSIDPRRVRRMNFSLLVIALLCVATAALLRSPGEIAKWYSAAAKEEIAKGNKARAIELIEKAIGKSPDDVQLYYQLAAVLYEQEQYEPCLKNLTIAIDKQPHKTRGYLARAAVFHDQKRYREAVRDADTVVELAKRGARDITYHDALNNAAYFRALSGEDLERGLRDAEIAVARIRAARQSVDATLRDDMLARAHEQALGQSLARTLDTRGYLHYKLAKVAESRGDGQTARTHLESAREDFDEALDLHVRNMDDVHKQYLTSDPLARSYWRGDFAAAFAALGEMHYNRGLTLQALGEDRRADRDFQRARDCGFDVEAGH